MMSLSTLKKQIIKFSSIFCTASHIVVGLIGLIFGFLLYTYCTEGFNLSYNKQIDFSINPFEFISLAINFLLAVYVLRKLNKHDEGNKTECNLIINYVTSFDTDFNRAIGKIAKNDTRFDLATSTFKTYGIRIETLLRLAKEQKFIDNDSTEAKALLENIKDLRDLLTNTPKDGAVEDGIRIKDGKLSFSETHLEKIMNTLFLTHNSIFSLIVEINRTPRK